MERLACVDAPAFALQLLLRRHAEWRGLPAAVIDRDAPHGVVLGSNEAARAAGVWPGLRYAAALASCPSLRAGEFDPAELAAGVEHACELLRRHSPHVEPSADEPGVFWIDVAGLETWIASQAPSASTTSPAMDGVTRTTAPTSAPKPRRTRRSARVEAPSDATPAATPAKTRAATLAGPRRPPLADWALAARASLAREGLECAIAVGFSHFGVYAAARSLRGGRVVVFDSPDSEHAFALRASLRRLGIAPAARAELEKLGVRRVADLVKLPRAGVRVRFGDELARLHALASLAQRRELAPRAAHVPLRETLDLDLPISDLEMLLALAESLARPLLAELARRGEHAAEIELAFELEDGSRVDERVEPAAPTLEFAALARLLRLRLERVQLPRGVQRIALTTRGVRVARATPHLFALAPGRDGEAARKAFAALAAAFGAEVVVRPRLVSAHLPEAGFRWEAIDELRAPQPREVLAPSLVRRILARPIPLPSRGRREDDGWMLRGVAHGPVLRLHGPYPLCGGWWRSETARDYHYAEMHSGALLWIYFDRVRRRWLLHGSVS